VWDQELQNDKDRDFLMGGIRNGFKISDLEGQDYSGVKKVEEKNHKSAILHKDRVEKELLKQIEEGHYVITSEPALITSPLGAIPKDDGGIRLIHDGSRPVGEAMNDYSTLHGVRFQTLEDAYKLAKPGYYLAKIDLKSAYRSVPIHHSDHCLTGLKWQFKNDPKVTYMYDARLPFGARNGCGIFHRLTQSVRRMMERRGFPDVVVYLDDFLIVSDSYKACVEAQHTLLSLLVRLGFLISWKKVMGPMRRLPFLGVMIDTTSCTLSLDEDKVEALKAKLELFKNKKRASKRQLQSLAGSLNWACQAVRGGRFFLRRVIDVINRLKASAHKAILGVPFKEDILWWLRYLSIFNGVVYYRLADNQLAVHTDACDIGGGAFWGGDWYYMNWKIDLGQSYHRLHINYKEVLAIVMAVYRWAPRWRNCDILVLTDNVVAKAVINRGHCKSRTVMHHLRKLFWLTAEYNFKLHAVYIPGKLNNLPDAISRLHEPGQLCRLKYLLSNWSHGTPEFELSYKMSDGALQVLTNHWSSRVLSRR
jgi:hypothetical protein